MTYTRTPSRTWYQSAVDPVEQAPYLDLSPQRLNTIASPGILIDLRGISSLDRFFHPITEFRFAEQTIRGAIQAQAGGAPAIYQLAETKTHRHCNSIMAAAGPP